MTKTYKLHVITPSKMFYEGEVDMVIVNTETGEEGFLANHAWACKLLEAGPLWIREAGSKEFKGAAISGGFVDVMEDIIIYADAAEWDSEIDTERALQTKSEIETWLRENKGKAESSGEFEEANVGVKRQEVRVKIAKREGRRRTRG